MQEERPRSEGREHRSRVQGMADPRVRPARHESVILGDRDLYGHELPEVAERLEGEDSAESEDHEADRLHAGVPWEGDVEGRCMQELGPPGAREHREDR